MYKHKHLAIICQNSRLPFIFEEAREMGIKVTFFFHSQESMPRELPVVSRYIGIDLFNSPEEALLEVKKAYEQDPFDGVITLFEPALAFTARVAQELNLRFLPLETILSCRNKNETRKILKENNLHTPVFYEIHSDQDLLSINCAFPMVVKPSNGFSSQGVVRVNTYEELLEAVRKVEEINKHDLSQFVQNEAKIIVEQFIDGPEFAIESFQFKAKFTFYQSAIKGTVRDLTLRKGYILLQHN
ncbi:acetyl-CoA carboxylase biotin carboxylase subunit family protein [Ectobacillus funiculus]